MLAVFETELIGIDGVPKPESIVTKETPAATTAAATEEATPANLVDTLKAQIGEKLGEAVKVVKSLLGDTDDVEEKAEL